MKRRLPKAGEAKSGNLVPIDEKTSARLRNSLRGLMIGSGTRLASNLVDEHGHRQVRYVASLAEAVSLLRTRFRFSKTRLQDVLLDMLEKAEETSPANRLPVELAPDIGSQLAAHLSYRGLGSREQQAGADLFRAERLTMSRHSGLPNYGSSLEHRQVYFDRIETADRDEGKRRRQADVARRVLPEALRSNDDLVETVGRCVTLVEAMTQVMDGRKGPTPFYARLLQADLDLAESPGASEALLHFQWCVVIATGSQGTLFQTVTAAIPLHHPRIDPATLLPAREWLEEIFEARSKRRKVPTGWRFVHRSGALQPSKSGRVVSGRRAVGAGLVQELLVRRGITAASLGQAADLPRRMAVSIARSCGKPMSPAYVEWSARAVWSMLTPGERKIVIGWDNQQYGDFTYQSDVLADIARFPKPIWDQVMSFPAICAGLSLGKGFGEAIRSRVKALDTLDEPRKRILGSLTLRMLNHGKERALSRAAGMMRTVLGNAFTDAGIHWMLCELAVRWKSSPTMVIRRLEQLHRIAASLAERNRTVPVSLIEAIGAVRGPKSERLVASIHRSGLAAAHWLDADTDVEPHRDEDRMLPEIVEAVVAGSPQTNPVRELDRLQRNATAIGLAEPWRFDPAGPALPAGKPHAFRVATPADIDRMREILGRDVTGLILVAPDLTEAVSLRRVVEGGPVRKTFSATVAETPSIDVRPIALAEGDWWAEDAALPAIVSETRLVSLRNAGVDLQSFGVDLDLTSEAIRRLREYSAAMDRPARVVRVEPQPGTAATRAAAAAASSPTNEVHP